jgi:hypothetical protein
MQQHSSPLMYRGRWPYHYTEGNVMAQRAVPFSLASFTRFWLRQLGLNGKKCLLVEESEENLPCPFSGSMKLYRQDGTCLELDTAAKPLKADCPYVREVVAGNFDLIVISIARWSLQAGIEELCPTCGTSTHAALQHTILHELVHVAFPEYSAHNEWTDDKVYDFLERGS